MSTPGSGLFETYLADVAVTTVFGLGYYIFKKLKNKNANKQKDDIDTNEAKLKSDDCSEKWLNARTIEEYNRTLQQQYKETKPFEILKEMQKKDIIPSIETYNSLLLNCIIFGNDEEARILTEEILDSFGPVTPNSSTLNILIKGLGLKFNDQEPSNESSRRFDTSLISTIKTFEDRGIALDVACQNSILEALIFQNRLEDSWSQFDSMKKAVDPDCNTFATIIKGIQKVDFLDGNEEFTDRWIDRILEVYYEAKSSEALDEELVEILQEVFVRCKRLDKAELIFKDFFLKRALTRNASCLMINSYASEYKLNKALNVFNKFKSTANSEDSKYCLDEEIYNSILMAGLKCKNIPLCEKLVEEIQQSKLSFTKDIATTLILMYDSTREFPMVIETFNRLDSNNCLDTPTGNIVLNACIETSDFESLCQIFDVLDERTTLNHESYMLALQGFLVSNETSKVRVIYQKVFNSSPFMNDPHLVSNVIDFFLLNEDYEFIASIYNDFCEMQKKVKGFQGIPQRAYPTVINSFCFMNEHSKAFEVFDEAVRKNIKLDYETYERLIKYQISKNFIDRGIALFRNMVNNNIAITSSNFQDMIQICLDHAKDLEASGILSMGYERELLFPTELVEKTVRAISTSYMINLTDKVEFFVRSINYFKKKGEYISAELYSVLYQFKNNKKVKHVYLKVVEIKRKNFQYDRPKDLAAKEEKPLKGSKCKPQEEEVVLEYSNGEFGFDLSDLDKNGSNSEAEFSKIKMSSKLKEQPTMKMNLNAPIYTPKTANPPAEKTENQDEKKKPKKKKKQNKQKKVFKSIYDV